MKKILLGLCALALTLPATAQWQQVHSSTTGSYSLASTKNGYVFAYKPGELLMSSNGGAQGSFTAVPGQPATSFGDLYGWKQMLFIIDGNLGLMRSLNYGVTWQSANNGMIGIDSTNLDRFIPMTGNYAIVLHDGSAVNKVYVSSDNGASWSATLNMTASQGGVDVVAKNGIWYLITTGTVYMSNDNGQNWNNLNVTFPSGFGGRTSLLSDGNFIMRPASDIYTSPDAVNWTLQSTTGLPANANTRQFIKSPSSDSLFLTTEVTPGSTWNTFYSADKGMTWQPFETGLPTNAQLSGESRLFVAHNGYMFASPDANGVYRTNSQVSASTVGVPALDKKNTGFAISPNPAQSTLRISFNYKGAGKVDVCDITGRVIMQEEFYGAVNTDLDIEKLSPGMYILTIKTDEGSITEKFVKQ